MPVSSGSVPESSNTLIRIKVQNHTILQSNYHRSIAEVLVSDEFKNGVKADDFEIEIEVQTDSNPSIVADNLNSDSIPAISGSIEIESTKISDFSQQPQFFENGMKVDECLL